MNDNRLTFIGPIEKVGRYYYALFQCVCGTQKRINVHHVNKGHTKSCGCLNKEIMRKKQTIHGNYFEPEHQVWRNMIKRCTDKRYSKWYGHVKIHPSWLESYEQFLKDMGRKPSEKHTLDRIDPKGNYEPNNVRWASRYVQARNTKNHETNTTGVRGISWSKEKNKWRAAIYVNNKQKHVGYFKDFDMAAKARQKAEQHYWKDER